LKPTRYRRRKQTALSIAALFSSSSENEEDNSLPLNVKRIVPVHSETINLETTSLQNENHELHNSNNTNSSMETSESSISSVDSYEDPSLQSNESLEVSIAIKTLKHLPKYAKTLLKTPTTTIVKEIKGGIYYHFGVNQEIEHIMELKYKLPYIHTTDLASQSKDSILSEGKIVYDNVLENCCCQSVLDLKCLIDKNEKWNKSINKQIMIQLTMLNNSNVKLCKSIENLDHKLQVLMKSDVRIRHQAVPLPTLPSAFIDIMPVKSIEELDIVKNYLSEHNKDHINYKEELKSFLLMKHGYHSSFSTAIREVINCCFDYKLLSKFSYKEKTKRKFIDLKLYDVINESLSGFITTPIREKRFHSITDNY
ncbi:Uncharacterized protein FWK35_00033941, partial [Aphis craccivora]